MASSLAPSLRSSIENRPSKSTSRISSPNRAVKRWGVRRAYDHCSDLTHRFADGVEECPTGVLHQMPSIGHLGCVRQCLGCSKGVGATAVAGDNIDLLLIRKPGLSGCRLSVRQKCDGFAPFEIADDRPVTLVAPPCPVIDADHRRRNDTRGAAPSDNTQQGVVADRHHQSAGDSRRRSPTQSKPEMMDDMIKPRSTPGPRRQDICLEALGKDPSATQHCVTVEPACGNYQSHRLSRYGKIR